MAYSDSIKPQDVALLVKLLVNPDREWKQVELAEELFLAQGEIAKSLSRLRKAELIVGKKPVRKSALEFLVYGFKFVFPVAPGPIVRGVPTAISAPMYKGKVVVSPGVENTFVWPLHKGKINGQSIEPLYPHLPKAAQRDKKFYEMIAFLDMLRIGRARERAEARKYIEKVLK